MIELVKELPDNVVGIITRGRVTNEECDAVLRPVIKTAVKRHEKLRLYYEIDARFPGAGWCNLDVVIHELPQWERIAIVTDTIRVREAVNALRFLFVSEVRVFTMPEARAGRAWIAASADEPEPASLSVARRRSAGRSRSLPPRSRRPSNRPARRRQNDRMGHSPEGDRKSPS